MPTLPNMTLMIPDEDGSPDIWDTIFNAQTFPRIDAHDHTTGNGVRIPSAALKINADVSWAFGGTNYSITDAKALDFVPTDPAGVTGYSSALFVSSADNNLYFRNSIGTNVKIIDGNTLNVSIVGGIGGDYSSVGALLDYDDATDTYRFRQETAAAVRHFAKITAGDVQLREYKAAGDPSVPSNGVTLKSPAALAAAYSITMPGALPAGQRAVQMDATGALALTNTFASDVAAPDYKRSSTVNLTVPASAYTARRGGTATIGDQTFSGSAWTWQNHTNSKLWVPIPLHQGDRLVSFALYALKLSDATNTITVDLYKVTWTPGGFTGTGVAVATVTRGDNAPGPVILASAIINDTLGTNEQFYLEVSMSDATPSAGDFFAHTLVAYDRP